jgi:hypothetical protein
VDYVNSIPPARLLDMDDEAEFNEADTNNDGVIS